MLICLYESDFHCLCRNCTVLCEFGVNLRLKPLNYTILRKKLINTANRNLNTKRTRKYNEKLNHNGGSKPEQPQKEPNLNAAEKIPNRPNLLIFVSQNHLTSLITTYTAGK